MFTQKTALSAMALPFLLVGCGDPHASDRHVSHYDEAVAIAELRPDGDVVAELLAPEGEAAMARLHRDATAGTTTVDFLLDGAGQTVVVELEDPSLQAANDTLYLFWWQYAAPVPLACKGDPENEGCCSGDYRCASCRFESDDWGGSTTTCCYGSCCTDWDDPALKDSCSPTGGGYEKY